MKKMAEEWLKSLDSRYPGALGLLPNGKPNLKDAQKFFHEASEMYEAIKEELSEKTG